MMKVLLLLLVLLSQASDRVYLKSGAYVDGDIIGKSDVIIKVYVETYHRAVMVEKDKIDSVEMNGRIYTFDQVRLPESDYNPRFKISPRVQKAVYDTARRRPSERDLFDEARKANLDREQNDKKSLNRFFNAPLRWGSMGFGYTYFHSLAGNAPAALEQGFRYAGDKIDLPCMNVQVRRNLPNIPGSVVCDIGYGRKTLRDSSYETEYAAFRYLSFRYTFCQPRWLFSPGLSAGLLFYNASLSRRYFSTADTMFIIRDLSLDNGAVMPFLGADFNLYDAVTFHAAVDLRGLPKARYFLSLNCLVPFLQ